LRDWRYAFGGKGVGKPNALDFSPLFAPNVPAAAVQVDRTDPKYYLSVQ